MGGPITALQTLDCDRSVHKFKEVNFSKLTDNKQIFRNDFDCIHYQSTDNALIISDTKILTSMTLLPTITKLIYLQHK